MTGAEGEPVTAWKKPLLSLLARGRGSDPLPSFVRVRSEPNTLVKRGAMQNAYGNAFNPHRTLRSRRTAPSAHIAPQIAGYLRGN